MRKCRLAEHLSHRPPPAHGCQFPQLLLAKELWAVCQGGMAHVGLLPYTRETQPWPQRPDRADRALQHPAKASPGGESATAVFRRKESVPHLWEPEHPGLSGNFLFFILISWIFVNTLFEKKDYVLVIILYTKHSIWKEKCSIHAY